MSIFLNEVKHHLRIDFDEDDSYLEILISAAEQFMHNATGKSFHETNKLAKTICMMIVADLYENRNMTADKVGQTTKNLVNMMLIQLSYGSDQE
ncbi:uncharacterized phage protein [Alkaliphilus metalliredigens QYMF]|uniref:Uncharacterized phage protein n=1 Tax=Alkaliphilus metalliredigens (strain QYMF) TaxID=293826 RepID=A6TQV2_ALKMQ|nr:head-tail connector protein [Alkaliphilus metalliredigens]ABR48570.1 uncharacterized phage protein [Alkaliphilus metalliredigens QYMF]